MNAVASFRPPPPEAKLKTAGRNEMMSLLPAVSPRPRESNGHEFRCPISKRAVSIVDFGADRCFAVAAAAGGSIATAVRNELDVVRDDLGGMALLAVLAFPVAKGQLAEDNDRLALLQPLL